VAGIQVACNPGEREPGSHWEVRWCPSPGPARKTGPVRKSAPLVQVANSLQHRKLTETTRLGPRVTHTTWKVVTHPHENPDLPEACRTVRKTHASALLYPDRPATQKTKINKNQKKKIFKFEQIEIAEGMIFLVLGLDPLRCLHP
jgi:hypothetical protein